PDRRRGAARDCRAARPRPRGTRRDRRAAAAARDRRRAVGCRRSGARRRRRRRQRAPAVVEAHRSLMDPQPLGPLFQLPPHPHYLWIAGVAVAVLAIAVLLVGVVRGRLPPTLLLPAELLTQRATWIGYLHTLDVSQEVAFCGSCHETMSPLVAALDEDNGTLASFHWRKGAVSHIDACFQCHSGYGIWGELDAKVSGINHMVRTV